MDLTVHPNKTSHVPIHTPTGLPSPHIQTFLSGCLPAQGHTLPSDHLIQLVMICTKDNRFSHCTLMIPAGLCFQSSCSHTLPYLKAILSSWQTVLLLIPFLSLTLPSVRFAVSLVNVFPLVLNHLVAVSTVKPLLKGHHCTLSLSSFLPSWLM